MNMIKQLMNPAFFGYEKLSRSRRVLSISALRSNEDHKTESKITL